MNLHEKATKAAHLILANGLFGSCALRQTNPQRAGSLNLMHPALRRVLDEAQDHDRHAAAMYGKGPSRFMSTVALVEQLRTIENFGLFKDLREPPYPLDETPDWRGNVREIEALVHDVLQTADALSRPAPDTGLKNAPPQKLQSRAVETLRTLLEISRTDAWSGSGRLDDALRDARDIVSEAMGAEVVIFSQEHFDRDGAGFWSNDNGWTELESAKIFREADRRFLHPPAGTDARWMSMAEAHGNGLIPPAAGCAVDDENEPEGPRP